MGIDPDGDPVGDAVGVAVPPRQALRDLRRLGVEHARAHVERVVVVEEADLGWLGGRLALIGVFLQEVLRGLGARPVGLVEPPVDGDLRGRAHGRDAGRRAGRRSGSRRRLPSWRATRRRGAPQPAGYSGFYDARSLPAPGTHTSIRRLDEIRRAFVRKPFAGHELPAVTAAERRLRARLQRIHVRPPFPASERCQAPFLEWCLTAFSVHSQQ